MDLNAWISIIALVLTVPLGVCSFFVSNWLARQLEQRKLIKANQTKEQAIRLYKRITAFRKGTKDKYAYYLLIVGWAAITTLRSRRQTSQIATSQDGNAKASQCAKSRAQSRCFHCGSGNGRRPAD